MKNVLLLMAVVLVAASSTCLADNDPDLKLFAGKWEVVELVEDGRVVPPEAFREWLPSGGRIEIADNAIIFTSPHDGTKQVKLFSIDATQYPKGIDIVSREKKDATGIYRFDEGRLILCLCHPTDGPRPTEFSAKDGSKRMLMVLKQTNSQTASQEPAVDQSRQPSSGDAGVAAKVLTDAEVAKSLAGTWRYKDEIGALLVTFTSDGNWSSIREVQELRLFQKVFVRTPVSSGKWTVQNGTLTFTCTASVDPNRVNRQLPFTVRSITQGDFIFVDYMGRLGKAVRVQ